jgi:hypothetical protein
MGDGHIVTTGKFTAKPPSYYEKDYINMPEGKMFHSLQYGSSNGKGAMGSYAFAMSKEERWKVIMYVKSLQTEYLESNPENAGGVEVDTTNG